MVRKMKAAVVEEPGEIEIRDVEIPKPNENEVLIEVRASGICHSDKFCVEGVRPGIDYPRVPGHEVAGIVRETGAEVDQWKAGDRVGVGWHGAHCFECEECRKGDFKQCEHEEITGLTRDGGHAEYMVARQETVAEIPDSMGMVDAAPVMCAGVTTYNALRNTDARPGDTVAVIGIGGLGHLGVQYASKGGFRTVAVSHSPEKEAYARELGADYFVDSSSENVAERLQELGGATTVLSTAPIKKSIEEAIPGLGTDGELVVLGPPGSPVEVETAELLQSRGSVSGFSTGHARDSQDTMEFTDLKNVEPETETYDLEDYEKAYSKMMDGEMNFRGVIEF